MADSERYKIPLFDGSNYSNWKFHMETLLEELELVIFTQEDVNEMVKIDEREEETTREEKKKILSDLLKKDKKCKTQIIMRIYDTYLEYVKDENTSYRIWKSLSDIFERKSIANQLLLRKKLLTMKFNPHIENIEAHYLKFDKTIRELKASGATLEETDIVCHLVLTMPMEYDTVVTAIETLSTDKLTLDFVKSRLLDEQSKRNGKKSDHVKHNSQTAFVTPSTSSVKEQKSKASEESFRYKCYYCGMIGHKRSDCKKLKNVQQKKRVKQKSGLVATNGDSDGENFSFPAVVGNNTDYTFNFVLDSGAIEHLVNDENNLVNIRILDKPIIIKVAKSGESLVAHKAEDTFYRHQRPGKRQQRLTHARDASVESINVSSASTGRSIKQISRSTPPTTITKLKCINVKFVTDLSRLREVSDCT